MTGVKRVVVHIDRLLLHGVRGRDRDALADALREELGLLLAEPGAVRALTGRRDSDRVQAGRIRIARERGAADTGRAVAGKVVRAIAT